MIKAIENLPEVSFIDGITLDVIQARLTTFYQQKYKEVKGKSVILRAGEPEALKLYAVSVILMQIYENVENKKGKWGKGDTFGTVFGNWVMQKTYHLKAFYADFISFFLGVF